MLRLRQIALVARDLDAAVRDLHDAFGLEVAFQDPAVGNFGLVNAVLPVGEQFVEVVSPTKDGTAAGRQLDRMGGDGGYMVITHTDDQAPFKSRAEAMGIRTAFEGTEHGYCIWQLHPGDTGGSFLEIDFQPDWDAEPKPWMPAGPDWQKAVHIEVIDGITGVDIEVPDIDSVRARWAELLGQEHFDNAELRWTTGIRGIVTVDVRATDRSRVGETHTICGVVFQLR